MAHISAVRAMTVANLAGEYAKQGGELQAAAQLRTLRRLGFRVVRVEKKRGKGKR